MDEAEGRRMAPTDERLARDKHGQEAGVAIQAADRTSILQVTPNDGGKGCERGVKAVFCKSWAQPAFICEPRDQQDSPSGNEVE